MRIIFVLLIVMVLSGCSFFETTKPLDVSTVPIEKVPLILPETDQYQGREIEWIIVTPDNYKQVVKDLKRRGSNALFALSSKGYENISLNQSDILKLIKQQREIIAAYEKYYQADFIDQPTDTSNDEIPEIE